MRVYFKTFGCRVNQYETQQLREAVSAAGAFAVPGFEDADLCVVNTCTVTAEADREALALLRRISRRNPAARLVVTGCLATRDPRAVRRAAPAALVAGNAERAGLPALLGCSPAPAAVTGLAGRSRAFVKVQDGCNMNCAFCVIPSVRPGLWSKPWPALEAEVRGLVAEGCPEIVLCGVRLGRYLAEDPAGRRVDLCGALERLAALPGRFRLRLSSLEVTDVSDRLLSLVSASRGRVCPSLHVPLQSGSDAVLRRMRRWSSSGFYLRRLAAARERVPGLGLFADVIVGFPGETRADFEATARVAEAAGLDGLHAFRFSARPGTEAAGAGGVPPEAELRRRAQALRELDGRLRAGFAARAVGGVREAAVELGGRDALTEDFLQVRLAGPSATGLARVRVLRADGARAFAELLS